YQIYVNMMKVWNQYGGGLFNAYQMTNTGGNYGYWGMLADVTSPGSQKWDALMSAILPAGDASLDGTVDYSDFQILQAQYGQANTWWEQGDFNNDGKVNWADLNILRTNL